MEFTRRNISEVLADPPEICAAHLPSDNSPILIKRGTRGYVTWRLTTASASTSTTASLTPRWGRCSQVRCSASIVPAQIRVTTRDKPSEPPQQYLQHLARSNEAHHCKASVTSINLKRRIWLADQRTSIRLPSTFVVDRAPKRNLFIIHALICSSIESQLLNLVARCAPDQQQMCKFLISAVLAATISWASPVCLAFAAAAESGPANFPPGEPGPKPDCWQGSTGNAHCNV